MDPITEFRANVAINNAMIKYPLLAVFIAMECRANLKRVF